MERVSFDLKIWILSQKRKIKLHKTYVYILVSSSKFNPESWWDFLSQAFIHWCFSPGELSLTWKSTLSSIMKYFEMIKNRSFSTTGNHFFTLIGCYDFNHWKLLLYPDQLLWLQPLEITSLPWSVVMTSFKIHYLSQPSTERVSWCSHFIWLLNKPNVFLCRFWSIF